MSPTLRDLLHGAIAGAIGAGTMTLLRTAARRAGLIDAMVPEAVERWAAARLGAPGGDPVVHRLADQAIHHAYGAALGAGYGLLSRRASVPSTKRIVGFGIATWALGGLVLFPALRIARPAWRARPREVATDLAAHLAYAGVVAYLTDELARAPNPRAARTVDIG